MRLAKAPKPWLRWESYYRRPATADRNGTAKKGKPKRVVIYSNRHGSSTTAR